MVSPATHLPNVLLAYLRRGEAGLAEVEERLEEAAHDQPEGKFSKAQAAYLPQAPIPPTLWRTSCGRCRFWEEGEPGEPGRCHIVGRSDDRFGGEAIHYRGWCGYWMPPAGEPAFAWIDERLHPDGRSSVRGQYDPEMAEKEHRRERRATVPSAAAERREAVRGEEVADGGGVAGAPETPQGTASTTREADTDLERSTDEGEEDEHETSTDEGEDDDGE